MKKILVAFDDDTAKVLAKYPNQSEIIREATKLYIEHISTGKIEAIAASYKILVKLMKEVDSKVDYLASIDKHKL